MSDEEGAMSGEEGASFTEDAAAAAAGPTTQVRLSAADIPGAELAEPLEKHQCAALRWWLLCRGMKVPTSVRKKDLIDR